MPLRGVACGSARSIGQRQARLTEGGKHVQKVVVARCWRPTCPRCYPAWAARKGNEADERLRAAADLHARNGRVLGPARHFVFSPPQERAAALAAKGKDGVRELKAELLRIVRPGKDGRGLLGGLVVYHEWRTTARGEGKYRKGGNFVAPHFHVVAYGFMPKADEFEKRTGWVYKNKDRDATRAARNVAATVTYLLDHAAIIEGTHALSWFGLVGYSSLVVAGEARAEELLLCECGEICYEHPLDPRTSEVDWASDVGPYYAKVRKRTFALRDRPRVTVTTRATELEDLEDEPR